MQTSTKTKNRWISGLVLCVLVVAVIGVAYAFTMDSGTGIDGSLVQGEMGLLDAEGNKVHTHPIGAFFTGSGKAVTTVFFDFKMVLTITAGKPQFGTIECGYQGWIVVGREEPFTWVATGMTKTFDPPNFNWVPGKENQVAEFTGIQARRSIEKCIADWGVSDPSRWIMEDVMFYIDAWLRMKDANGEWIQGRAEDGWVIKDGIPTAMEGHGFWVYGLKWKSDVVPGMFTFDAIFSRKEVA